MTVIVAGLACEVADRVRETTLTTGAGTYLLSGAATGFQTFVAGIGSGNRCLYTVALDANWEVGIGTVTTGTPATLSRDDVLASSNNDNAVNWGAGTKDVWVTMPAALADQIGPSASRNVGVSASTDIPDRAAADTRYAQTSALGTAAFRTVGVAASNQIPDRLAADGRYAQTSALGTAAFRNVGVSSGTDIPDRAAADARYALSTEALGTAAFRDVGVGAADQIPDRAAADGRYARLGANNTYSGEQAINNGVTIDRTADLTPLRVVLNNGTATANVLLLDCGRPAAAAYDFIQCQADFDGSGGGPNTVFRVNGAGTVTADGSFTGGGAGFAEFYEWDDGNQDAEDRVGVTVITTGRDCKIRPALPGEDPIGVVTGQPAIIGNANAMDWKGKYLTDAYGRRTLSSEGGPILSPDYDPSREYVPRSERHEYACVSLLGRELIRPGQPVGRSWRLMHRPDAGPEIWLVMPGSGS